MARVYTKACITFPRLAEYLCTQTCFICCFSKTVMYANFDEVGASTYDNADLYYDVADEGCD